MGSIEQVVNSFKDSVNINNEYSLKELLKLLESSYKKVYKTKNTSAETVKKAPSAYNIFIKEAIAKMKADNLPGVDPKDYMRLAAQKWQEHKNSK